VAVWWVLGLSEVAIFLRITTNLLERRGVMGRIATNLTNRHDDLGFNIHRCTSVTKNRNTS
jgi:cyanophycinase-like exopeptidase